eukprot:m.51203 g.51203  ORF g.51203 m.51203 type:complete len:223 (+) comp12602_c1_seq2:158-826(+)
MAETPHATEGKLHPDLTAVPACPDWEHSMRWDMQEIIPNLFLGPYGPATKLETMLSHGITHIICARTTEESCILRPRFQDRFTYLIVDAGYGNSETIVGLLQSSNEFMANALGSGGRVFVHDNVGISVSCALVMAFLMHRYHLSSRTAFNVIQRQRACVAVSVNLLYQLESFASIQSAQRMTAHTESSEPSLKRQLEQFDDSSDDDSDDYCIAPPSSKLSMK